VGTDTSTGLFDGEEMKKRKEKKDGVSLGQ
jgi:hypothetical protein